MSEYSPDLTKNEIELNKSNYIDTFKIAYECYADENAIRDVNSITTYIIDSNINDGAAKWLKKNFK